MLNCLIVDDDSNCRSILKSMIESKFPELNVLDTAKNLREALIKNEELKPDVVFLDVELGDGSGFDFLEQVQHNSFKLIFTTAFDSYAVKAFKVNASDYLLKPFSPEELEEAVKKVTIQPTYQKIQPEIQTLIEYVNGNRQQIPLPVQTGYEFVKIADIIRLEAKGNYTEFHLKGSRPLLVSRTLKIYDDLLSMEGFCRIHSAHLINMKEIRSYHKGDGGFVTMSNNDSVDVSRSKKDMFISRMFP
jgi:two-component system LytT family response regulator